jgi:hypothetical protein
VNRRYSAITSRPGQAHAPVGRPDNCGGLRTVYSRTACATQHAPPYTITVVRSASLENTFILSKDVLFRDLDGEAVILDLDSGRYFGLNAVGTRIWRLIEQHGQLSAVFAELCREYDAAPDELKEDLLELVSRLAEASLGEMT